MSKLLYTLRENGELTENLWQRFKEKAVASGHSPTTVLARLIKRYIDLDSGDDDARERREDLEE